MNIRSASAYMPGAILLALCLPGWWLDRTLFWAVYLSAWWFCTGLALGALAHVWLHNLTGGAWGTAIRDSLLALARPLPLLALLFIPLFIGINDLYPWAATDASGVGRWSGELARPGFKSTWLTTGFFVARSIVYLVVWIALERVTRNPRFSRSKRWSAFALIAYTITASLAAIDWVMSLMPVWYSTSFGLVVICGQMLAALSFAIVAAALRSTAPRSVFRDLGNLLLTYVLTWAYLAYTQYLIIWAENLPHEIAWYVPRLHTPWEWAGALLILCHFFIPLPVLLSRFAKEAPRLLGALAAGLLALHLVDMWWLVVPSVRPYAAHVLWLAPLAALGLAALGFSHMMGKNERVKKALSLAQTDAKDERVKGARHA